MWECTHYKYARYEGPIPWSKKLNPCWWPKNDHEPCPPDKYKSDKTQWQRIIYWWLRNPFCNFTEYVIGVLNHQKDIKFIVDWKSEYTVTHRTKDKTKIEPRWQFWIAHWKWFPFFGIEFKSEQNHDGKYWHIYTGWRREGIFASRLVLRPVKWGI